MKNRIKIFSDGINAYATLSVKSGKTGLRLLSLFLILEIIVIFIVLSQINPEEIKWTIIPGFAILIIVVGLPVKYLLWNLYGSEELIVNTKSISWSYDYGFFNTKLETLKFDRLGTDYERIRGDENEEVGKLIFYNYRAADNLPEIIHETTVLLNKDEIREFNSKISDIFSIEFLNENGFIPFSEN